MKVVVLGKGLMLANILLGCVDAGADIVGVFRYDCTSGSPLIRTVKDIFNPTSELSLIKELNLKEIKFTSANSEEFKKYLIKNNVDIVFIGTWKEKIKKDVYSIPTIGTINLHPSLLPKYRGPNPYMQTILNGESFSGVTLHLVDDNYDTGAILSQKKVFINDSDTSKELRERTVLAARELVRDFLRDLNEKIVTPVAQNEKVASYYKNISGEERMLNFQNQTSEDISRTIRALHPFLPCYITYKKSFFIVNPYDFSVSEDEIADYNSGDIVSKDASQKSISIVCSDKKIITFRNLKLYGEGFFTGFFIDKLVKISKVK